MTSQIPVPTKFLGQDAKHPAKFSAGFIDIFRELLIEQLRKPWKFPEPLVLDPFAGVGTIHELRPEFVTFGMEIEPEWADCSPFTYCGDSTQMPNYWQDMFQAVVTSPCLEQSELVLTHDLRWVPAGDVQAGDELLAFDEFSPGEKVGGRPMRRRYRVATVTQSYAAKKECVAVCLDNGQRVICTTDHPWLANRYSHKTEAFRWVEAKDLLAFPYVSRQFTPWQQEQSFDAGWLSGMFDGEGSIYFGTHGAPKLSMSQKVGPLSDRFVSGMTELDIKVASYEKSKSSDVMTHMVTGGVPDILSTLGRLRPDRLIANFMNGNQIENCTVQPERVKVVAVIPVGMQNIQGITTSTGTYIGAGFLHHNTYGNRMADHHTPGDCSECGGLGYFEADVTTIGDHLPNIRHAQCPKCLGTKKESSKRMTYRHVLGRELNPGNTGMYQFTQNEYKQLHYAVYEECHRILEPGGIMIVNVSDHIRKGQRQPVCQWHKGAMRNAGFTHVRTQEVSTNRMGFGANSDVRVDTEEFQIYRKA